MPDDDVVDGGFKQVPDEITQSFLEAVGIDREYDQGIRQMDEGWVNCLLNDPDKGEVLEVMLRNFVGVGRREPAHQPEVDKDTQAIIASIRDPNVVLTGRLARHKDHFLRSLDLLKVEPNGEA